MSEFFDMGGYAGFVWPAYGVAAVVMIALLVASWRKLRSQEKTLEMLQATHGRRRRRRAVPAGNPPTGTPPSGKPVETNGDA